MLENMELLPGIQLYTYRDNRFKQGALSIQFVRPMKKEEAAYNALLPAVLLRGTKAYPDLRAITLRLDDLYGASVSTLVRRIGDYQTTGFYCNFMEDKFALDGDEILKPMLEFVFQLLLDPVMEDGGFSRDFVESEKKNLISTIEAEKNDKRVYASGQLMKIMCEGDCFGLSRLGEPEDVKKISPKSLYDHYRTMLKESPVQLFYVGSAPRETVAAILKQQFESLSRDPMRLAPQSAFSGGAGREEEQVMDVTQAKLCMGFVTPVTNRCEDFAAMQVLNAIFGGGMTSKLFMTVREKMSLCYYIGSSYYGSKGLVTVSAGVDADKVQTARKEIFAQLDACREGAITNEEMAAAKEAVLSALRTVHDSPGAIEGYYATAALSCAPMSPADYARSVAKVSAEDVVRVAKMLNYHSGFLLKGVES
jgi:predicted Zn-dependent peptidase